MTADDFIEGVLGDPAEDDDEARGAWRVDSLERAEWAAARYAKRAAEVNEVVAARTAWLDRIEAWADAEVTRIERDLNWLEAKLTEWHRRILADEPRRKTVRLPSVTLTAYRSPDRLIVRDEDAALEWAKRAGEVYVRTTEALNRQTLRKVLRAAPVDDVFVPAVDPATGELVPGLEWERGGVRHCIKDVQT